MQITITCSLIVADELSDSNVLEADVQAWGQRAMVDVMNQAWQCYQAAASNCSRCQSTQTVADGVRPDRRRTVCGTVELAQQRRRCRACDAVDQLLDDVLPAAGPGRVTTGLVEAAVLAVSSWPFATAADVLARLSGAAVSPEWVRLE